MKNSILAAALTFAVLFSLGGCAKQPVSPVVTDADGNRMIERSDSVIIDGTPFRPRLMATRERIEEDFYDFGYYDLGDKSVLYDVHVIVFYDTQDRAIVVSISGDRGASVAGGLKVGSTPDQVRELWSEPSDEFNDLIVYFFDKNKHIVSAEDKFEYFVCFVVKNGAVNYILVCRASPRWSGGVPSPSDFSDYLG